METGAQLLGRYLDELARVTDEPGELTRTFLSPAMRLANALVAEWMSAAGLAPREDTAGNLIARLESPAGPRARENVLHMLWEMEHWLDTYVKPPAKDKKL